MRYIYHLFPIPLLIAFGFWGCKPTKSREPLAARVGDSVLTIAELEASLPSGLHGEAAEVERAKALESWIADELLYEEALAQDLDQNPRVQKILQLSARSLLIANLLDSEFDGREVSLSENAILRYYEENLDDFQLLQPQVRARHILLSTRRDANAKLQALNREVPFDELAREYSKDQESKFVGGELGYFTSEEDPILWELCQNLTLNNISKPLRTEYGHHIIQVLDRQDAGTHRELYQVRPQIVEILVRDEHDRRLAELITRLKESADWEILDQTVEGSP